MKISKSHLQQIIKEEMQAELSEDKYATEDDRPLGTGRSLMSSKDAERALEMAEELAMAVGGDEVAAALAADLAALLKKGVAGMRPEAGTGGPSSAADMERWESDYRDPPRKPLPKGKGRKVSPEQARREYEMMKDYDI